MPSASAPWWLLRDMIVIFADVCLAGSSDVFRRSLDFGHPDTAEAHSRLGESLYRLALAQEKPELTAELLQAYEHFNLGAHAYASGCTHYGRCVAAISTSSSKYVLDNPFAGGRTTCAFACEELNWVPWCSCCAAASRLASLVVARQLRAADGRRRGSGKGYASVT